MAVLPKYLIVKWDTQPTEWDDNGMDGLYVKSVKIKWWGWSFVFVELIKRFAMWKVLEYKKTHPIQPMKYNCRCTIEKLNEENDD